MNIPKSVRASARDYVPAVLDACRLLGGKAEPVKLITETAAFPKARSIEMVEFLAGWFNGVAEALGVTPAALWRELAGAESAPAPKPARAAKPAPAPRARKAAPVTAPAPAPAPAAPPAPARRPDVIVIHVGDKPAPGRAPAPEVTAAQLRDLNGEPEPVDAAERNRILSIPSEGYPPSPAAAPPKARKRRAKSTAQAALPLGGDAPPADLGSSAAARAIETLRAEREARARR